MKKNMAKNTAHAEGFLGMTERTQEKYARVFGTKMKLKKTGIVSAGFT